MSEFHVEVVRIGAIEKHPNADTLSITQIHGGYPVCFRTGEYNEGDLAVYVPVDAVVPDGDPRWDFLQGHRRIRAKRLRGVFSMGLLTPREPGWQLGDNVQSALGIVKWEPEMPLIGGDDEADPGILPIYTDIEGWRRWKSVLQDGEQVVVTEKIHGENFRAVHDGERLWLGSRTRIKALGRNNQWNTAAAGLTDKLVQAPGIAFYGECHGYTGGFPYGTGRKPTLRFFDALDTRTNRYLDRDQFDALCARLGLEIAPELYRGPWSADVLALADGKSTLDGSHVREGIVIKPLVERWHDRMGRVILKFIGEDFLLKS